jgi:hypothetical protein
VSVARRRDRYPRAASGAAIGGGKSNRSVRRGIDLRINSSTCCAASVIRG